VGEECFFLGNEGADLGGEVLDVVGVRLESADLVNEGEEVVEGSNRGWRRTGPEGSSGDGKQ
jgi:hypothetical protein